MLLTLQQAADQLGKTRRQLRYLIKSGKLQATKAGGHWRIDSDLLPRSPAQQAAEQRKHAQLAAAIEDALDVPPRNLRKRYSLRDLRAFQIAAPLYRDAAAELGSDHPACRALRQTLEALSRGCHRYVGDDKATAYRDARDQASRAACEFALAEHARAGLFLECVEQELMAALAGLLRRLERPARRAMVP